jgi:GTP-binding protein
VKTPTVAIIGRPNVGKSTLFNRLIGRKEAIVDGRPGVTRDRNFAAAEWNGRRFWMVDTGGLIPEATDALNRAVRAQVEQAVAASDVVVFLVDVAAGVHPADLEIAQYLRKAQRTTLLVANKADQLPNDTRHLAFYELGLGDPFPISAAVGKSSGDLLDRIVAELPPADDEPDFDAIHVAVVGRPNVGKSSLVNQLLGEDRLVVAAEPGTTRDAIDTPLVHGDHTLVFIDTAGLRKRSKVQDEIEFYSTLRTARAMERADVCVLVVDAVDGVHAQDLKIANDAWDRGAGVIIAVNKWDLIEDKETNTAVRGEKELKAGAPFLEFIPFLYVSAKTGQRVPRLLDLIVAVAAEREKRVPTAEVNRVLEDLLNRQQPPQPVGEPVRVFYASQIGTAPPKFALIANRPEAIPESYVRYLVNGFRAAWEFTGAPVNVKLRRKRKERR